MFPDPFMCGCICAYMFYEQHLQAHEINSLEMFVQYLCICGNVCICAYCYHHSTQICVYSVAHPHECKTNGMCIWRSTKTGVETSDVEGPRGSRHQRHGRATGGQLCGLRHWAVQVFVQPSPPRVVSLGRFDRFTYRISIFHHNPVRLVSVVVRFPRK